MKACSGSSSNGGAAAAADAWRGAVGGFLLGELRAHGVVASGDQLHELLAETRAVLGSAAFRLTLADLLACSSASSTSKLLSKLHKLANATLASTEPFGAALLATPSLDEFCWMAYAEGM